jgi:hypothetical protein
MKFIEQENEKLGEKVRRYKKEAKKSLKSINDTAIDELKRVHEEKEALTRKIIELE